jgi:Holliday junction DNA helicase RuvB
VVEPYLIQEGFLVRTSRGRMIGDLGWRHLGFSPPQKRPEQGDLLGDE